MGYALFQNFFSSENGISSAFLMRRTGNSRILGLQTQQICLVFQPRGASVPHAPLDMSMSLRCLYQRLMVMMMMTTVAVRKAVIMAVTNLESNTK